MKIKEGAKLPYVTPEDVRKAGRKATHWEYIGMLPAWMGVVGLVFLGSDHFPFHGNTWVIRSLAILWALSMFVLWMMLLPYAEEEHRHARFLEGSIAQDLEDFTEYLTGEDERQGLLTAHKATQDDVQRWAERGWLTPEVERTWFGNGNGG